VTVKRNHTRGSGPADGTKHIWGIGQHTFCLGVPTVTPADATSQKLLRAPRRPVKTQRAGPGRTVHRRCLGAAAVFPVR